MPTGDDTQNGPKRWQECAGAYDFLEQVRLRPGMWLPGGSLRQSESMLIGYRVALGIHQVDEDFDFWSEDAFREWLRRRLGRHSPLGWAAEIERETPAGSTAVEEFLRLLDACRAEQSWPSVNRRPPAARAVDEHPAMRVVRIEIARYDWDAMVCGCGRPATHLPAALIRLISAGKQDQATFADIENHAMIQSNLMEPAPAATAVILAALADLTLTTPLARTALLELLLYFSAGDTIQQGECAALIRAGVWILFRELVSHPSPDARLHAYETLSNLDTEQERLAAFRQAIREHLPTNLQ